MSNKNLPFFCFFVSSKNQTSCTSFLQTGTWNLTILEVFLIFSTAFPNIEAAFERCSTKKIVQQNNVMKQLFCTSGQIEENVTWKFTKNWTLSQLFFKAFNCKLHLDGYFGLQLFLDNILELLHSQRLVRRYIHFKSSNGYTYFTFLTVTSCLRGTDFNGIFFHGFFLSFFSKSVSTWN